MISLVSEMTDTKGRHARGWLFFDAECRFCTGIAQWLATPIKRRGLKIAPLQDPRVGALLGLSQEDLLSAVRFVFADGRHCSGADALLAVACELWWARPLIWFSTIPGALPTMRRGYAWSARRWHCKTQCCMNNLVADKC